MVTGIVTGTRRDWYKIDMVTDLIGYEPGHVIGGVAFSGLGGFATPPAETSRTWNALPK